MTEWIVSSSILILIVILLRALLRGKISGQMQYALWAVVLVRLLLPVQLFAAPVSVEQITPNLSGTMESVAFYGGSREVVPLPDEVLDTVQEHAAPNTVISRDQASRDILGNTVDYYTGCQVLEGDSVVSYTLYANLGQILFVLWAAGCLVLAGILTVSNVRFSRRLRRCRQAVVEPGVPLPVYVVEWLPSPCLFGVLRPAIYLTPAAAADDTARRHVLCHEQAHYRHWDHIWSLLRSAALVLHWYNPLVWWAVSLSKQDGELACDACALKTLGEGERIAYGRTLLSLLSAPPRASGFLTCTTTMANGVRHLRERIRRIAQAPKQFLWAALVMVLATAGAVILVFSHNPEGPVWQEVTVIDGIPYGRMGEEDEWTALSDTTIDPPQDWAALPGMGLAGRELATYLEIYEGQDVWGQMVNAKEGWLVTSLGRGVAAADTYAYRTEDGGRTWQEVNVPSEEHWYPCTVGFLDSDRLIIAYGLYEDSPAYLTKDGGETWERIALLDTTGMQVSGFTVSGETVVMHLVYGYTMGGWALQSDDLGDTWELVSTAPQYSQSDFPIQADLDHDGTDEDIHLEIDDSGTQILTVSDETGIIWSDTGRPGQAGGNTVVLLTINSQDYLMRYTSALESSIGFSGGVVLSGSYYYCLFSLTGQGEEDWYHDGYLTFDTDFDRADHQFDPLVIAGFLQSLNTYLGAGTVLLNTNAELVSDSRTYLQETLPWLDGEEGFLREPGLSLYQNLLNYQIAKAGAESLTAQQVMAGITAGDISRIHYGDNTTPEELAQALRLAAGRVKEGGLASLAWAGEDAQYFPIWTMAVELKSLGGAQSLLLRAGLSGSLVEVTYVANGRGDIRDSVVVDSNRLHTIVSEIYDREEVVDSDAFERYSRYLNQYMSRTLVALQEIDETAAHAAGYYNYDVTEFTQVGVYDDALEGMTVEVYAFDYAIAMERPEYMRWVGGTHMDSSRRMRGYDLNTYFAAYYQDGELAATRFLGYDLFFGETEAEGISRAKEQLAAAY